MNIFFAFKRSNNKIEIATPPLDGSVIPGIMRKSVIELGKKEFKNYNFTDRLITI